MEALASIAKVVAAVVVGLPLAVYFFQDGMIFHPQQPSEARRGEIARRFPAVEEVRIESADGKRLQAWLVKPRQGPLPALPASPAPLVLYFGGNAEEVSWMLEQVGNAPSVGWLITAYRGYGASEGQPSERALIADALLWYEYARKLPGVDTRRIYAFGRSLGSGVAVPLAAGSKLAGVILVTPPDSLTALAQHYYPFLPVRWILRHPFDSLALAPRIDVPLLCFIAARDEVVPPVHSERLFEAWGGPKLRVLLEGATHNTTDEAVQFWHEIRRFLG